MIMEDWGSTWLSKEWVQLCGLEDADPDIMFSSMLGDYITTMLKTSLVPAITSDW